MGILLRRGILDELANMDNPLAIQGMAEIAVTYCGVSTYGGGGTPDSRNLLCCKALG